MDATLAELDAKGWTSFARDAGLGLPLVRRRVVEIAESVQSRADQVAGEFVRPGLDESALAGYAQLVSSRVRTCAASIRS